MCFFQRKCWICWILGGMLNQNVLKTAEMLNMLNMLNVFGRTRRKGGGVWPSSPQNIQHIQHIQHFPWKKHILIQHAPEDSTYSTFLLKEAHFFQQGLWDKCFGVFMGWGGGGGGRGGEREKHAIPIHHPPSTSPRDRTPYFQKNNLPFPPTRSTQPPQKRAPTGEKLKLVFHFLSFPQPKAHFQKSF